VKLLSPKYPIGSLVKEQKNYGYDPDCRYGMIFRSEMIYEKDEYIDVYWFSDSLAVGFERSIPYFATTSTKRIEIISKIR